MFIIENGRGFLRVIEKFREFFYDGEEFYNNELW